MFHTEKFIQRLVPNVLFDKLSFYKVIEKRLDLILTVVECPISFYPTYF